jgi:hypothetical protein
MSFAGLLIAAASVAATPPAAEDAARSPTPDASTLEADRDEGAAGPDEDVAAEARARGDAQPGADPECDRLFGTEADREVNEAARKRRLVLIEDGPSYIDVVQTGGWREPREIAYRGLTLKETLVDEEDADLAVIEVEPTLGFCEPGEYEVEVDDSIGAEGRVLAILPGIVVVQHAEELRYLRSQTYRGRPTFKVSWRSPFSIVVESESSGKSSRSRRSARRRRRRR